MYYSLLIIILVTTYITYSDAKQFMRCELCKELIQKHNFDKTFLSNWICMIEHESGRDTSKITQKTNGSKSYGIFQINNRGWCADGRKGGNCNAKCEDFIDEDIRDDVTCARKIYARDGFRHWDGWVKVCRQPENLLNLSVICSIDEM